MANPFNLTRALKGVWAPKYQIKLRENDLANSVPSFLYVATSASDAITAVASNNAFVDFAQTYALPAKFLNVGSVLRVRAQVAVTDASGTDTLTCKVTVGANVILTTTAVDPTATTDLHTMEFILVSRANASSASSCVASGSWSTITGTTVVVTPIKLAATNFATDAAMTIKASAKWSSNTASTSASLLTFTVEGAP